MLWPILIQIRQASIKGGVRALHMKAPKMDMTSMVDLGFLLICFFVVTTQLSQPVLVHLAVPKDKGKPTLLGERYSMTILLNANDLAWYYFGNDRDAVDKHAIKPITISSTEFRKLIAGKRQSLDAIPDGEGAAGLMLLIKPTPNADYRSIVDMLDEIVINKVKKYAIVKPGKEELNWIKNNQ
jgi:biopolymer transport protein ExbD